MIEAFSQWFNVIVNEIAQQKVSTVASFNAIPFYIAMTILVHNWVGKTPISVAFLRYIEKISIGCQNLKKLKKNSKFRSFYANSVEK